MIESLDDRIAEPAIETLRGDIADANFEAYERDAFLSQSFFGMNQKFLRQPAAAVFGRNADRRDMSRAVFIERDKNERRHRIARRGDAIAQSRRFGKQIGQNMFAVMLAAFETALIQAHYFIEIF